MPYMLNPANYTQTMRPNLYNMAYRRIGAYKGMGRLHPSNYLEIGVRPNRIGGTSGQYTTLAGQLSLLPPSLRGLGRVPMPVWDWRRKIWRRGLGQTETLSYPGVIFDGGSASTSATPDQILSQMQVSAAAQLAAGATPADVGATYPTIPLTAAQQAALQSYYTAAASGATYGGSGLSTQTLLLIGGGILLLALAMGRR